MTRAQKWKFKTPKHGEDLERNPRPVRIMSLLFISSLLVFGLIPPVQADETGSSAPPTVSFDLVSKSIGPAEDERFTSPLDSYDSGEGEGKGEFLLDEGIVSPELSKLEEGEESVREPFDLEETVGPVEPGETIADPLEPINRLFYHFNDKLYFWLLKPVARGYRAVAPEPVRVGVRNFFHNLLFPVRFVNCLFQGKFFRAGDEMTRFFVNTIVGGAGVYDVAAKKMNIKPQEEDLGQTFGVFGLGPAFYIDWPILGPSSLRDTFGLAGDAFLNPVNYVGDFWTVFAIRSYDTVNSTSLSIGDYESLKESALDPYVAIRDAYHQYRQAKIKQ